MHSHYMNWIDAPIPALNGRTPREACATQAGRRKVAILINTKPSLLGPEGTPVDVPRKQMRTELGFGA